MFLLLAIVSDIFHQKVTNLLCNKSETLMNCEANTKSFCHYPLYLLLIAVILMLFIPFLNMFLLWEHLVVWCCESVNVWVQRNISFKRKTMKPYELLYNKSIPSWWNILEITAGNKALDFVSQFTCFMFRCWIAKHLWIVKQTPRVFVTSYCF